ncbi:hypothetical protein WSM22_16180 [Cytophagales bacterium WSM2-2]|nr:hypothetical protein WSM22_16180 [Cytophagales bacterium WSM2-2]
MKIIYSLILLLLCELAYSQKRTNDIDELIKITNSGLAEKQTVSFSKETSTLTIGTWKIPVSRDTQVKFFRNKGKYEVEFMLQRGTVVTSTSDVNAKKAWFTLTFNSRQSAKEFTRLFSKASK